jgi:hypothetical protein
MIRPTMKITTLTSFALFALALIAPATHAAPSKADPTLSPSGDENSRLPAGYQGIVWGADPISVEAMRGRPLERQTTTSARVIYLIEAPLPGDKTTKKVVKWKFWENALTEVQVLYEGPFSRTESREIVYKFESRYGAGRNEQKKQKQHYNWDAKTDLVVDEWWTWEDRFTTQMLKKNFSDKSWTVVRKSRVMQTNRDRRTEEDRLKTQTDRVQEIELD